MKCLVACLLVLFSSVSTAQSTAQDCQLPTADVIKDALIIILNITDDSQDLQGLDFDFFCLAQGSRINTYRSVSVLAMYNVTNISVFHLDCFSSLWDLTASEEVTDPDPDLSIISTIQRFDCADCGVEYGLYRCRGK